MSFCFLNVTDAHMCILGIAQVILLVKILVHA